MANTGRNSVQGSQERGSLCAKSISYILSLAEMRNFSNSPFLLQIPFKVQFYVLKLNASTTTRSTTRCSGDLMGDQMAPGRPDRSR